MMICDVSDRATVSKMRYGKHVTTRRNMSDREYLSEMSRWSDRGTMNMMSTMNTREYMTAMKYMSDMSDTRTWAIMNDMAKISATKWFMGTIIYQFIMTDREHMSDVSIMICSSNKYSADMIMMNKRTVCKHGECNKFLCR